jgi:hypothetical protein
MQNEKVKPSAAGIGSQAPARLPSAGFGFPFAFLILHFAL